MRRSYVTNLTDNNYYTHSLKTAVQTKTSTHEQIMNILKEEEEEKGGRVGLSILTLLHK
jgi:hypothetical protein